MCCFVIDVNDCVVLLMLLKCPAVTQDGQMCTVRHFNFTEWPEQVVPKLDEAFIYFIGQVHVRTRSNLEWMDQERLVAGNVRTNHYYCCDYILEQFLFISSNVRAKNYYCSKY